MRTKPAKVFHLCSYGTEFAGEVGQCQKSSEDQRWVELKPGLWVAYCKEHYDQIINDREDA